MSKTKNAKTTKKKPAKKSKAPKEKKLSAIDAAAQVLAASKEPLNAKEMIEAMSAKALWTSPGGKTPHATLYSAIIREIALKGKESRFMKMEQGSSRRSRAHQRHVVALDARRRASLSCLARPWSRFEPPQLRCVPPEDLVAILSSEEADFLPQDVNLLVERRTLVMGAGSTRITGAE